jgi:hypothetical protein
MKIAGCVVVPPVAIEREVIDALGGLDGILPDLDTQCVLRSLDQVGGTEDEELTAIG